MLRAIFRPSDLPFKQIGLICDQNAREIARSSSRGECRMSRTLIVIGLVLVAAGVLWPWIGRLGLGRLPGDIIVERENFSFYFPLMTSLIISVVLSAILWLVNR
jgi:DUF2905 family protein